MKQKSIDNKYIMHVECLPFAAFDIDSNQPSTGSCTFKFIFAKKVHKMGYKRFNTLILVSTRKNGIPIYVDCYYYNSWLECLFKFITILKQRINLYKSVNISNLEFYNNDIYNQFQKYWSLVVNKACYIDDDIDRILVPYIPESAKQTKSK